jgi:hypothetical protein
VTFTSPILNFRITGSRFVKGKKGSAERNYRGLHVFDDFIERLNDVAKSKGVERISLMVAHAGLYPVFSRHGFVVSRTKMAQIAFKGAGVGYPMIRQVT